VHALGHISIQPGGRVRWAQRRPPRPADPAADPLLDDPRRVGKPLTRELGGYHSARRGGYRVIFRIDDAVRVAHVVRIDLRADVYRTR
jgi:mRNA-degrading endonuclease RelE of RelBE toxin-antitoxin system